jgi:DNA polymerase I-like protein with 3'-5' exonuclease and polymerase domains
VQVEVLNSTIDQFVGAILILDLLISNIHEAAGEEFNINSPKQLGVVLFETLELPVIKRPCNCSNTSTAVEYPVFVFLMTGSSSVSNNTTPNCNYKVNTQ